MWLVRNGIPFDVAFTLNETTRTAFSIVFSEFDSGKTFDWSSGEFRERK